MARRPRVGVTGNHKRISPSWWCISLALRLSGAIPERISVRHAPSGKALSALIISGGDDISPEHYGGSLDEKVRHDPARDALEIDWIKRTLTRRLPLLGICRGAQLINVVLGGNLHEDVRDLRRLTYNRPGLLPTKQVRLDEGSQIARILGSTHIRVNSLHHQAIREPGQGLLIVGQDLDKLTQAIEAVDNPVIGVQWHPEYLLYLPSQLALFRWLCRRAQ